MIAYRNHHPLVNPLECVQRIELLLRGLRSEPTRYEKAVSLLIECGEFETGMTDVDCGRVDEINREITFCREMTVAAGRIVCSMWEENSADERQLHLLREHLQVLKSNGLPKSIPLRIPEGFVYYGLYPETFMQAADIFLQTCSAASVLVVGIRSIGTSLSALVAARLENHNVKVHSITVRPKGHPFNRYIEVSDQLKEMIRSYSNDWCIVVDEGPGLSGSSITGTLLKIEECGFQPERVVVFPSWNPESSSFVSARARSEWNRHLKFLGSFDDLWVHSGRLEYAFQKRIYREASSGLWRSHMYDKETDYPVTHPHHERRKFFLYKKGDPFFSVAKFIGLGRYGERIAKRGELLAQAGFSPALNAFSNGFADYSFIEGDPLRKDDISEDVVETSARYCAFISKHFQSEHTASYDQTFEMIEENVSQGLGKQWLSKVDLLRKMFDASFYEEGVVAVDGRMMPHEWIRSSGFIYKVDHLEHHADQFFHGPQNIAWDIAGFAYEWDLSSEEMQSFLDRYIFHSKDPGVRKRLPFYNIAYLAFRLGYCTLALESLHGQPDGSRYRVLVDKFQTLLQKELETL